MTWRHVEGHQLPWLHQRCAGLLCCSEDIVVVHAQGDVIVALRAQHQSQGGSYSILEAQARVHEIWLHESSMSYWLPDSKSMKQIDMQATLRE